MAKILVVDDIPAIVDFSKEFFEDAGFEVRTADTAPGAIEQQHQFKADVILQPQERRRWSVRWCARRWR